MRVLVIGGTKFFGVHTVHQLLEAGDEVTVATRGQNPDPFGDRVKRIVFDRSDAESCRRAFAGQEYDVVLDQIAYSSNDVARIADAVSCRRYVMISSNAVYRPWCIDQKEDEFDASTETEEVIWCERTETTYGEGKRNAERAALSKMPGIAKVFVRYPYVIGIDDYTKRLKFYVQHVKEGKPMFVNNLPNELAMITAEDAGRYTAWLVHGTQEGACNGASDGTVKLEEVVAYAEQATGRKAVFAEDGDAGPYNGTVPNSLNTDRAKKEGFAFSDLRSEIFPLLDALLKEEA